LLEGKKDKKQLRWKAITVGGMVSLSFENPPFDKHNTPHGSGTSHLLANYIHGLMLNQPV